MQQITVDINPGNNKKTPIFNASQYDVGREFRANLVENLVPYTLDGTELLTVSVRKGDNTLFTADISNTFGGKSYVDFVSTEQMCACAGFSFGELSITKNNTRIGTVNFMLVCEPSPEASGLTSESEINNLNRQIDDYLDETLPDVLGDDVPPIVERVIDETLAPVATSGSYNDLLYKPTIPAPQVNSDWNANSGVNQILNKPNLSTVATSGDYNDLLNKPSVAVIDDTTASASKVWSSEKTSDEIINILPTGKASGLIANFNTPFALPLVSCNVGSGATQITRCGYNVWDEQTEFGMWNDSQEKWVSSTTMLKSKNYIPIVPNTTFSLKNPSGTISRYVYYDKNKNYLSFTNANSNRPFTTPANAYYMMFGLSVAYGTTYNNDVSINYPSTETTYHAYNGITLPIAEKNNIITLVGVNNIYSDSNNTEVVFKEPIDNAIDDRTKQLIYSQFFGKKIAYNGDSICAGSGNFLGGYAKMIAELTGGKYFNNAIHGGHLAVYSDRHIVCETVSEMPDDADLICFEGGINDYWNNCVIGSLTSGYTDTIDTTTLMGALESIFRQAIAKWVGKPICFIIVHKVRGTDTTPNSNGDTFTDFHDAIIEACNKYSIPYLDMFLDSGMNCNIQTIAENYTIASSSGQWGVDGCHPTENGYKVYYISKILEFFKKQLSMY